MNGSGSMGYGYYMSTTAKYVNSSGYNNSSSNGLWNGVDPLGDGNLDVSGGVYKSGGTGIAGAGMFVVDVDWDGFYRGVFNTSYFGVFGMRNLWWDRFPNYNANVGNKNVGRVYETSWNHVGAVNNKSTDWMTAFVVDGDVAKTGVNSYLSVVNASDWESYMEGTVGGAMAEVTRREQNLNVTDQEVALWFSGAYRGSSSNLGLNLSTTPYVIRSDARASGGFFISAAPSSGSATTRPLCKTAILSHLETLYRRGSNLAKWRDILWILGLVFR